MAFKVNAITSEEELEKAQASALAQGSSITNYSEWSQVMKDLNEAGVESTGSYAGDKAKLREIEIAIENFIKEIKAEQATDQRKNETQKVEDISNTDKEQGIKATIANATSSEIMTNYMKYYHLLM